MLNQTLTLPEDPEELRSFTARLLAEVKAQAILIEKLRHQLAEHRAHRFGASSETAEQLQLALETSEIAAAAMTARMKLPNIEDLDRSTLADWVGKTTALLEPLAEVHENQLETLVDSDGDLLTDALRDTLCQWIVDYNLPGAAVPSIRRIRAKNEKAAAETRKVKADAAIMVDKAIATVVRQAAKFEDDQVAREYIVSFDVTDGLSDKTIDALVAVRADFANTQAAPDPFGGQDPAMFAAARLKKTVADRTSASLNRVARSSGSPIRWSRQRKGTSDGGWNRCGLQLQRFPITPRLKAWQRMPPQPF